MILVIDSTSEQFAGPLVEWASTQLRKGGFLCDGYNKAGNPIWGHTEILYSYKHKGFLVILAIRGGHPFVFVRHESGTCASACVYQSESEKFKNEFKTFTQAVNEPYLFPVCSGSFADPLVRAWSRGEFG